MRIVLSNINKHGTHPHYVLYHGDVYKWETETQIGIDKLIRTFSVMSYSFCQTKNNTYYKI